MSCCCYINTLSSFWEFKVNYMEVYSTAVYICIPLFEGKLLVCLRKWSPHLERIEINSISFGHKFIQSLHLFSKACNMFCQAFCYVWCNSSFWGYLHCITTPFCFYMCMLLFGCVLLFPILYILPFEYGLECGWVYAYTVLSLSCPLLLVLIKYLNCILSLLFSSTSPGQ